MQKIKMATDSTADIPVNFCEELNISVLPLTIRANDKDYRDGIDISTHEFYKILEESQTLPVSSQLPVKLYSELYENTYKDGYTDLIQVTLNSKGSGAYQTAVLCKIMFFEENPDAKDKFNIHNIIGFAVRIFGDNSLEKLCNYQL